MYSVAVAWVHQRRGVGRELVKAAVKSLKTPGRIKVNLQMRSSNHEVKEFYE